MKYRYIVSVVTMLTFSANAEAAISIDSGNLKGFDSTTSAIVDNTGAVIIEGSGFAGIGTFGDLTDEDIRNLKTSSDINNAFDLLNFTSFNAGDGLWQASLGDGGDTSSFAGKPIFTVIGNGSDILTSDQFLIYRHTELNGGKGVFNEAPGTNEYAVVAAGAGATGHPVVGQHGKYTYDFGAGEVLAFNLVPEPSSISLLGLGLVGFTLRRRR